MPAPTASAKILDPVLQIARHSQQDLPALLSAAQLQDFEKDKPGARFPASAFCRLLEELARRTDNERIALRIGEATQPRMLGSIGFLMTTAADLRAACRVLIDYLPLLSEGIHLQMEQGADSTELLLELENPQERKSAEWFLACLLSWPRWLSGKQIPALKVEFIYPPPTDPSAWERFFAAEVSFNADRNRLLIPNSYLSLPCLDASEEMHRLHLEFADNLLSVAGREGALIARIKSLIRHSLSDGRGAVRREQVAAGLNMSLRTLQRKLGGLNTSYQDLYDQTRRELALQQIQKGGTSFGELSFMLGFSGQSAFQKAFRRWTGQSPSGYRNSIRAQSPSEQHTRQQSLAALIPEQGLGLEQFFSIALQLTSAVGQLHQQGERCRDLCPAHISIESTSGAPRLSLMDPQPLTAVDALQRLAYLAPESIGIDGQERDQRSDLYSLGCIFVEMLSGQPPYPVTDAGQLLRDHLQAPLPALEALPEPLQQLIHRLLARQIGQRSQSCQRLQTELLSCQQLLLGEPNPLSLPPSGEYTGPPAFPATLYGRDEALKVLHQALQQTRNGESQLVLIRAAAGMGKSALVRRLRQQLIAEGGRFISGQFQPLQQQPPWSAIVQAAQQLIRQQLSGPEREFRQWRRRLLRRAGADLPLLAPLLPEIQFIGPVQQPAQLSAAELKRRISRALLSFFSDDTVPPLTLFVDDLQWIDPASAELLQQLLHQRDCSLLIIAAARNDQADAPGDATDLSTLLQSERCHQLGLNPLSAAQTRELVGDIFRRQGTEVYALAGWLHRQTGGNPFYIRRGILRLCDDGWISFDSKRRCWSWKKQLLADQSLAGGVEQLLSDQISALPEITRDMLCWGAALGDRFDLELLARVSDQPLARLAIHLWPALEAGLIRSIRRHNPQSEQYHFQHPHIRKTAYLRCESTARQQMHLSIARVLQRRYSRDPGQQSIYDLVNHLNRATPLLSNDEQRLQLIRLNMRAAEAARNSSAFAPALSFLSSATEQLVAEDWQQQYELCSSLQLQLARAEYLCGETQQADARCRLILAHSRCARDRTPVIGLQAEQLLLRDRCPEAVELLLQTLKLLQLPLSQDAATLRTRLQLLAPRMENDPTGAESGQEMDRESQTAMQLLQYLHQAASRNGNPQLAAAVLVQMAELSLDRGRSPQLPLALAGYAWLANWILGDCDQAQQLAGKSVQLAKQSGNHTIQAATRLFCGARIQHWSSHLRETLPILESSHELALQCGDGITAGHALLTAASNRWMLGHPLQQQRQLLEQQSELLQSQSPQLQQLLRDALLSPLQQLSGSSPESATPESDSPAQADDINRPERPLKAGAQSSVPIQQSPDRHSHGYRQPAENRTDAAALTGQSAEQAAWCLPARLAVSYLLGQRAEWPSLIAAEAGMEQQLGGYYAVTEGLFYIALMRLQLCDGASQQQRDELLSAITYTETRLELWARHCPASFSHRQALITALKAVRRGLPEYAMEQFEKAIEGAEAGGFVHHQALACEHYGRFWQARGRHRVAVCFLDEAQQLYRRWGALEKVRKLRDEG